MAEKQYNYIYSKLVKDQNDVVGMLAYSIYKQHKIEFIEDFKKKKNAAPTDSDIENFIMSSVTQSPLEKYRESANAVLSEIVAKSVQTELMSVDYEVQKAVEPVVKKHSCSSGKTICLNIVASFIFSIILVIIFILGYTTESGLREKTKAVIETIQGIPNDSTTIKE